MPTAGVPVVNLQRDDFCVTLAASLAFFSLAVICTLWHPEVQNLSTNDRWIDVTILFSTCTSIILLLIALFKLICGRGDLCSGRSDYEEIDDVSPLTPQLNFISPRMRFSSAANLGADEPGLAEPGLGVHSALDADMPPLVPAPASARLGLGEGRPSVHGSTQEPAAAVRVAGVQRGAESGAAFFAAGRGVALRPVELAPLADGEIDSGIQLERADHQFLHHGLHFDEGTWRVLQVRKGSCCDRQGTCGPGDIILSLNGVTIASVEDHTQVASLLRGRAGSAISIEVIHVDCRHAMSRQLILAPSPADLGMSSRSRGSRG